ncbi:MAG: helix-turn-helix domain-containing protein [Paracoccaceae bacterium]
MESLIEEIRALREDVATLKTQERFPPLMTPAQTADFLSKSEEVLYVWRKERTGPPYLHVTSRSIFYDRDEVIAWARSHRVETK